MTKAFETRTVTAEIELRGSDAAPVLEGYAATFNQEYDLGPFRERIDPAAFNRTLGSNPDVRLLIDHEGQPLARTKSGTLTLAPDGVGLRVRAPLEASDPDVQRLLPKMRRKDLDQMSFAFKVPSGGDTWENDYSLRTLRTVELHGGDVSVVTYPANENTSVAIRARDLHNARCVFADVILRELRAGKTVSAANMTRLRTVLDELAKADDALDAAEAAVAEIIGVPDPDDDDGTARAAMPTSEINDLPDSAFAYIEPGGKKDSEGKTVPRSLRHFPIHDAEHVRNALARAPQSPFGDKAMPKIKAAAKKFGIEVSDDDQANSARPLGLALAIAQRLTIPA